MRSSVPAALLLVSAIAHGAAAQQPITSFTVGTAVASRGTTAFGALIVPAGSDSGFRMPVVVIHGTSPGPVVAFVAGAHGTEYASIIALQRLSSRINATVLRGTVIIAPLLNVASFEAMTPHLNPVDRKSMNGQYPGDSSGTQTQRALALVTREIVAPSDVIVDLHGGDLDEDLRPYSYWMRGGKASQDSASRDLTTAFGLDHIIVQDVNPTAPARSLSGQALTRGKTVVVAEAGRSGMVAPEDVSVLLEGSLNVLARMNMINRPVSSIKKITWLGGGALGKRVTADSVGVFFPTAKRDTRVLAGTVIGYTTDYAGRKIADIKSPADGLITFIRGVPSMAKGSTLVSVLPVLVEPPAYVSP